MGLCGEEVKSRRVDRCVVVVVVVVKGRNILDEQF